MQHWLDKVAELLTADTSDLRELARIAGGNPETFYLGVQPSDLHLDGQDIQGIGLGDVVSNHVTKIQSAKNRGERLSMLLDAILRDRSIGLQILDRYPIDKSKFANISINALRDALHNESKVNRIDNVTLVRTMRKPLAHQLGESRATFLLFMAKHLSKYPDIKVYLRRTSKKFTSREFERYREQIDDYLR